MGIICTIIFVIIVIAILKALAETERGAFVLILLPIMLLTINFTIAWDNYWEGVPFPNPIDPGGFINDLIARIIGGLLDSVIGTNFFRPLFSWLLGMCFYSLMWTGLHIFFFRCFLSNLDSDIRIGALVLWLAFFTVFYYFHLLDNFLIFDWFSMPLNADANIKWYYWISIVATLYFAYKE